MISVKNAALACRWLLTKESQGKAKGQTIDFNGSQEAKVLEETLIFIRKKILLK